MHPCVVSKKSVRSVISDKAPFGDISGATWDRLPADDEWRGRCRSKLKELGRNQDNLAEFIREARGAPPGEKGRGSQSGVSQALSLKKRQDGSRFVHAISLALGVELPVRARLELAVRTLEKAGRTTTILKYLDLLEDAADAADSKKSK